MGTKKIELTGNEVIDIFARRAGGQSIKQIAEDYPFSTAIVADVLYRRKRADVPIPAAMLETVQATYQHKPQKRRTTCPPPNVSAHTVLAQYTAACHELNVQRRRCKQAGIPSQTLDLLRESIQVAEGVNGDGTG